LKFPLFGAGSTFDMNLGVYLQIPSLAFRIYFHSTELPGVVL